MEIDENVLFETIYRHYGHKIVSVCYGSDAAPENVAIECEDCGEVIIDVDAED